MLLKGGRADGQRQWQVTRAKKELAARLGLIWNDVSCPWFACMSLRPCPSSPGPNPALPPIPPSFISLTGSPSSQEQRGGRAGGVVFLYSVQRTSPSSSPRPTFEASFPTPPPTSILSRHTDTTVSQEESPSVRSPLNRLPSSGFSRQHRVGSYILPNNTDLKKADSLCLFCSENIT